jgi:enterochelin esterase-like enzyme
MRICLSLVPLLALSRVASAAPAAAAASPPAPIGNSAPAASAATAAAKSPTAAAEATREGPGAPNDNPWARVPKGDPSPMKFLTYRSPMVGVDVGYAIYLPPGYEEGKTRYPVVYWLHGASGRVEAAKALVVPLDAAIRAGKAPPFIVVAPKGRFSGWLDSKDGKVPTYSLFLKEFIPFIERTYRAIPKREARALEGFSMGAGGAARFAFANPELFAAVSPIGGGFRDAVPPDPNAPPPPPPKPGDSPPNGGWDEAGLRERSPVTFLKKNAGKIRGRMKIRLVVGEKDERALKGAAAVHALLESLEIEHENVVVPGIGHSAEDAYAKYPGDPLDFWRGLWQRPTKTVVRSKR